MTQANPTNESVSPLYEQIVADFLARLETDAAIPNSVVKRLKAAFADGPPKTAALAVVFDSDDDIEQ